MEQRFYPLYVRFHMTDKEKILVCGCWKDREEKGVRLLPSLDYTRLPSFTERQRTIPSPRAYLAQGQYEERIFCWITLPETYQDFGWFRVFEREGAALREILRLDTSWLARQKEELPFYIDQVYRGKRGTVVRGWCIARDSWKIRVGDARGGWQEADCIPQRRPDVERAWPECERDWIHGFVLETETPLKGRVDIEVCCDGRSVQLKKHGVDSPVFARLAGARELERKARVYCQQFGIRRTVQRGLEKLSRKERTGYDTFRLKYFPTEKQLAAQREETFPLEPEFSIVVPLYRTPEAYLEALLRSVREQTYGKWRLYLSDGSGPESPLEGILERWEAKDSRICVIRNREKLGIAENTNRALEKASGDFLVFADHDDTLAPDALYECVRALNQFPKTDVLYTDEDKISMDGKEYYQPHFKPDFNLDFLRSANYICHMFVVRRSLAEQVGYLDRGYEGSQDYDFILRCTEQTERIVHIPRILYHWRVHPDSVAGAPESKSYAYEAGRRALLAHYQRVGIPVEEVEFVSPGYYRTVYRMEEEPLLSIMIPNKDHKADLQKCLESIWERADYSHYEILVVENNSEGEEIREYYRKLEQTRREVRILEWKGEFNFSAIQNYAVQKAKGEYLLLLNNDTWMAEGGSLRQMLALALREDVGITGARLLYPDGSIQHAGVIVGLGGVAGHAFAGEPGNSPGYFCRITCAQDYSAVTAACMLVKKKAYLEAGGMDTRLKVAFNDTDFCLRVGELGYRIVYQPSALWYHDESKTRGAEDTEEKLERFRQEIEYFQRRWRHFLEKGDPCYNPNLTLERHDFSLRL